MDDELVDDPPAVLPVERHAPAHATAVHPAHSPAIVPDHQQPSTSRRPCLWTLQDGPILMWRPVYSA